MLVSSTDSIKNLINHPFSQSTLCSFLFKKEESELEIEEKNISQILEKIEERSIQALTKGELFLFDALGGNDQCHFTALMICRIYQQVQKNTLQIQKGNYSSEACFLHLAFILSSLFFRNKKKTLNLLFPKEDSDTIRAMAQFIGHPSIMQESKQQLAQLISQYVEKLLKDESDSSVFKEIALLNEKENLKLNDKHAKNGLYCFPKFTGVLITTKSLDQDHLPLIFKIKVLCSKGQHLKVYYTAEDGQKLEEITSSAIKQKGSTLVVEGFAGAVSLDMEEYKLKRTLCAHGLFTDNPGRKVKYEFRNVKKSGLIHKLNESCELCKPCTDSKCSELILQNNRMQAIQGSAKEILHMIGADFTLECQDEYTKKFFANSSAYPILTELFQKTHQQAKSLGVTAKNPSTFLIEHVYPDTFQHALQTPRLLDTRSTELLEGDKK